MYCKSTSVCCSNYWDFLSQRLCVTKAFSIQSLFFVCVEGIQTYISETRNVCSTKKKKRIQVFFLPRYFHKPPELGSTLVEVTAKQKCVTNQRGMCKSSNKIKKEELSKKHQYCKVQHTENSLVFRDEYVHGLGIKLMSWCIIGLMC